MRHPTNMLTSPIARLQRQTNRQAHKIDIADIRKQLTFIKRKLRKVPLQSNIGIARISHTRLYQRRTRVQCKGDGTADAKPEACAGEVGDCHARGGLGTSELDGAVSLEGRPDGGGGGGKVGRAAVGGEEEEGVGGVEREAGYGGVDLDVGVGPGVDEVDC